MPRVARLFLAIMRNVANTMPQIISNPTTIGITIIAISPKVVPVLKRIYAKKIKNYYQNIVFLIDF